MSVICASINSIRWCWANDALKRAELRMLSWTDQRQWLLVKPMVKLSCMSRCAHTIVVSNSIKRTINYVCTEITQQQ